MKHTYIHFEEYQNFFKLNSVDCLSGFNISNSLNYFFVQTHLPKKHFAKSRTERIFPNRTNNDSENLILVNLELFGKGSLNGEHSVFYLKPWIVDEGQNIDAMMEQVLFIIPDYIFYILLESELFKERFQWRNIENLDVINRIHQNDYLKYGLNDLRDDTNNFGSYNTSKLTQLDEKIKTEKESYEITIDNEYLSIIEEYYKI